jgi:hypothetical protein
MSFIYKHHHSYQLVCDKIDIDILSEGVTLLHLLSCSGAQAQTSRYIHSKVGRFLAIPSEALVFYSSSKKNGQKEYNP